MSVQRRPVPKHNPAPFSDIPYGPFIFRDDFGCVYSLDKFRPRFPLKWQQLQLMQHDTILPFTDDNVLKAVKDSIIYPLLTGPVSSGSGRIGGNIYWWSFDGVLVTLHKFKPFGSIDFNYSLLLEFNPNKHLDNSVILALIARIKSVCGEWFCWYNTRIDFTFDLPFSLSDVRLLSRKQGSTYLGTYYFGQRGSSGYTRVYDKRKEMLEKYHMDPGREVTRIEWEQRSGVPVCFDHPYIIGDLGKHGVLRYVPMNNWPAALQTFDPKTARKIKNDCLKSVPFEPEKYIELMDQLLSYLGLDRADCLDRIDKKRRDDAQELADAADLEKIQGVLRKFASIPD